MKIPFQRCALKKLKQNLRRILAKSQREISIWRFFFKGLGFFHHDWTGNSEKHLDYADRMHNPFVLIETGSKYWGKHTVVKKSWRNLDAF